MARLPLLTTIQAAEEIPCLSQAKLDTSRQACVDQQWTIRWAEHLQFDLIRASLNMLIA